MNFIEFTRRDGTRFLMDFDSHWEVVDQGERPALWDNRNQARNLDCRETYEQVKAKLIQPAGIPS